MLFSILIATLESRRTLFDRLAQKLAGQIKGNQLENQVEILSLTDSGEQTLGAKRNELIGMAHGQYTAFVDDDDDVSDQYVALIHNALRDHPEVDCLGIRGIVYFRGSHPHPFIYSQRFDHYFSRDGVYYRPPYTLNPVRRRIAREFRFEHVSSGEDIDWAVRLAKSQVLQSEHMIDETLYYYYSRRHWLIQRLIDETEFIRHPLGLQWANRLRVKRRLRRRLRK